MSISQDLIPEITQEAIILNLFISLNTSWMPGHKTNKVSFYFHEPSSTNDTITMNPAPMSGIPIRDAVFFDNNKKVTTFRLLAVGFIKFLTFSPGLRLRY